MQKLQKIEITNGVYWVEAADANVRILCGCPEDSVKHLSKQGLIKTRQTKDIPFETGPNVILLSDVLVQNGRFANLAEFPVLQMLYKQGMIIPNHPNNTGEKPMIIGSEDQVEAQMQYIYRGNYGLISEEELIKVGVSEEKARVMMALKLKFAFGKIRETDELLDTLVIKSKPVEIRNGVFVCRKSLNVFEFAYKGEVETVDLNLSENEGYGAPFSLGYHNISREYFAVVHSGQGDGWNEYRMSMSSILMFQGKIYLIDAVPNMLKVLFALGISVNEIEGIFHTHAHDDHFAGLPTLMRADHRMKYYSTPLVRSSVAKKLAALASIEDNDFSDYFDSYDLEFDTWNNIKGLEVMPIFSPHPVETNIFMFRTLCESGYKTYAHFSDIVTLDVLNGMIEKDGTGNGISQEFFQRIKTEYLQKVDLKKIDVGGGPVHGNADDFVDDQSDKLVLGHTSKELTPQQKTVGSGAAFGAVDVLIPTCQEYVRQFAHNYLQLYFPSAPLYQLQILKNNSVITFDPETIILKAGVVNKDIFLILTGNVEQTQKDSDNYCILSAGSLVGEMSGLNGSPSNETYRAKSFAQALRIPAHLYTFFVTQNNMYANIKDLQGKRSFLMKTWLFGYAISYPKQIKIAKSMSLYHYPVGEEFVEKEPLSLSVIKRGKLQICIGENVLDTVSTGNFLGEEGVLFEISRLFNIKVIEPLEVYHVPGELLLNIPAIRWKLLETFKKRRRLLLSSELHKLPLFNWRKEFSVNVKEMDDHHRLILEKANTLHEAVESHCDRSHLEDALNFLVEFVAFHFVKEEALMEKHNYPEFEIHKKKHEKLIEGTLKLKERLKNVDVEMNLQVLDFFKDWIFEHILTEDRKYGPFLHVQGVS